MGDDVRDMEPAEGPLTLSFPLATVLDAADAPERNLLTTIISGRRVTRDQVDPLRQLIDANRTVILDSASSRIEEKSEAAASLLGNSSGQHEVKEIVMLVKNIIADAARIRAAEQNTQ